MEQVWGMRIKERILEKKKENKYERKRRRNISGERSI